MAAVRWGSRPGRQGAASWNNGFWPEALEMWPGSSLPPDARSVSCSKRTTLPWWNWFGSTRCGAGPKFGLS